MLQNPHHSIIEEEDVEALKHLDHLPEESFGLLNGTAGSSLDEKTGRLDAEVGHDPARPAYEHGISASIKLVLLGAYLALNLALTLSLKVVLQRIRAPWMLTAMHAALTAVGCDALLKYRGQKYTALSPKDNLVLVAFSTLFTTNIAVSNISLAMVSVPFHQTVRSLGPLFTVILYRVILGRHYSIMTVASLFPIVFGVCLFAYGNFEFTVLGFSVTMLGIVLVSFKTIATNQLLTGTRSLDPIELLARMSPLAAVQASVLGVYLGELTTVQEMLGQQESIWYFAALIAFNCSLALMLNISSFKVNKLAGALALNVCGNVKQCLTVALAIPMFGVHVGLIDGLGMLITMAGAAWFSLVELRSKK